MGVRIADRNTDGIDGGYPPHMIAYSSAGLLTLDGTVNVSLIRNNEILEFLH